MTLKLHIGAGTVRLPGWVNIDREGAQDLVHDVRQGLPFPDGSASHVYHEHLIEHLDEQEGAAFLAECRRVLAPGGTLRVATPDLDYVVRRYRWRWRAQAWLKLPEYRFIRSRGQMLNIAMRWWEHKYLYNEEDLRHVLSKAGFSFTRRCRIGASQDKELRGLETRPDSRLVLEARRQ